MIKAIKFQALVICFLCFMPLTAQIKNPYAIFNEKGKKVSYTKMVKQLAAADVILFGELHNNSMAHWLEYEIANDLLEYRQLMLGAEMFETDNQEVLTDYVEGRISAKKLDSLARLWKNFDTDYKPLTDLAKEKQLKFVATNVPRKYASLVFRGGFEALDTLPADEKKWLANLPILYNPDLPSYRAMLEMMPGHGGENLPKAQAIKDATMAQSILKNQILGSLFIHYNGSYHSNNFEGIGWYLKKENPALSIITINVVEQTALDKPEKEHLGSANFIIVVDKDVTHTY